MFTQLVPERLMNSGAGFWPPSVAKNSVKENSSEDFLGHLERAFCPIAAELASRRVAKIGLILV